jgi:pimeloyl-ACP methyl ester carboxylesterase
LLTELPPLLLNVVETGQGTPVALLHGLFGRAQNLGGVARRLAGSHRVLSLDLRNHGASPHAAGMDYATLAADVLHTLAARDALPAALLGHSMGGKTAMYAALAAPGQVTRLLVADIAPVPYAHHNRAIAAALLGVRLAPGMTRADAAAQLAGTVPDTNIRAFLLQNFLPGESPRWRIGLAEIADGMADIEGFAPPLGAVYGGPALFVRGGGSDYVLPAHQAAIAALFLDARVVTLANAGHWLHADQPERFGDIAVAFMAGAEKDDFTTDEHR